MSTSPKSRIGDLVLLVRHTVLISCTSCSISSVKALRTSADVLALRNSLLLLAGRERGSTLDISPYH